MLKQRTILQTYYECDKCKKEIIGLETHLFGMDLCLDCLKLWDEFWKEKQQDFLDANPNLKEEFLNS